MRGKVFAVILGIAVLGLFSGCATQIQPPRHLRECPEDLKGEHPVLAIRPVGGIGGLVGYLNSFMGVRGLQSRLNAEPRIRVFWSKDGVVRGTTLLVGQCNFELVPEETPTTIEFVSNDDEREGASCNYNRLLMWEDLCGAGFVAWIRLPKSQLERDVYDP